MRSLGRVLVIGALALLVPGGILAPGPVRAQFGEPEPVDLNVLALAWSRGTYLSPILCRYHGVPQRGGRGLSIEAGPRHVRPAVNRLRFDPIDAEGLSHCLNELGGQELNVEGVVQIRLLTPPHPDTAERDFQRALNQRKGFDFNIAAGQLRIDEVGVDDEVRVVDFRGGEARLHAVREGSDDARILGSLVSPRKVLLELEARDGTTLRFPLVMTGTS